MTTHLSKYSFGRPDWKAVKTVQIGKETIELSQGEKVVSLITATDVVDKLATEGKEGKMLILRWRNAVETWILDSAEFSPGIVLIS